MADLVDRISGEDDSRPKINLHCFMAYERLYAMGEWTRLQIATALDLQGAEATQATQIADQIDGKANIVRRSFISPAWRACSWRWKTTGIRSTILRVA
jgi:hypothetical protein